MWTIAVRERAVLEMRRLTVWVELAVDELNVPHNAVIILRQWPSRDQVLFWTLILEVPVVVSVIHTSTLLLAGLYATVDIHRQRCIGLYSVLNIDCLLLIFGKQG